MVYRNPSLQWCTKPICPFPEANEVRHQQTTSPGMGCLSDSPEKLQPLLFNWLNTSRAPAEYLKGMSWRFPPTACRKHQLTNAAHQGYPSGNPAGSIYFFTQGPLLFPPISPAPA